MPEDTTITPTLLLSMPQLDDPNFGRTVVLLCEFAAEGAFGLIVNRPTEFPASEVVQLAPPVVAGNDLPLWIGGPVEPERGWILLSETRDEEDAREIAPALRQSAASVVVVRGPLGPASGARCGRGDRQRS